MPLAAPFVRRSQITTFSDRHPPGILRKDDAGAPASSGRLRQIGRACGRTPRIRRDFSGSAFARVHWTRFAPALERMLKNMKRVIMLSALLLAGATGASAQDTRYNFDKSANFAAFKTYKW